MSICQLFCTFFVYICDIIKPIIPLQNIIQKTFDVLYLIFPVEEYF